MTDGFVSYWSDVMTKPDDPSSIDRSHAFAKKMIETPKVVFTKTLKKPAHDEMKTRQHVNLIECAKKNKFGPIIIPCCKELFE